jgi:hypothetical protein
MDKKFLYARNTYSDNPDWTTNVLSQQIPEKYLFGYNLKIRLNITLYYMSKHSSELLLLQDGNGIIYNEFDENLCECTPNMSFEWYERKLFNIDTFLSELKHTIE